MKLTKREHVVLTRVAYTGRAYPQDLWEHSAVKALEGRGLMTPTTKGHTLTDAGRKHLGIDAL